MRFALVLLLAGIPLASLAAEAVSSSASGGYVSPFAGYQGWSEPTVRDWQETHRLVSGEPSGHAGHGAITMPEMPSQPADQGQGPSDSKPMPGMNHGGMEMPADPHADMPHGEERQ